MANNTARIKDKIRQEVKARRNKLSQQQVRDKSLAICRHILSRGVLKLTDILGAYIAQGNEVNLGYLLRKCLSLNQQCYAPVINSAVMGRGMQFHQFNCLPLNSKIKVRGNKGNNLWRPNIYGIQEPFLTPAIPTWQLGVVFMPLVAYDEQGGRLGMGGGYYDRAFAFCQDKNQAHLSKPLVIGVAYQVQRVIEVPLAAEDIKLDAVVTENGWQNI